MNRAQSPLDHALKMGWPYEEIVRALDRGTITTEDLAYLGKYTPPTSTAPAAKVAPTDSEPAQKLQAVSAVELMGKNLGEVMFLVIGFLHQGLAVLSADPKIGKSWFALDLCLSIASGTEFLGYETKQAGALYLALEDSWRRLQGRMRMILRSKDIDPPGNFYLATAASPLDTGLVEQLDGHMKEHPDTKIIVIDVLERIRSGNAPRNRNAYQIDSAEIGRIKAIADRHNICVFMIHHNRKVRDNSDPFLGMSGSQGIVSSVDEGFTLNKEKRDDVRATLNIISREMGDEKLILEFDKSTCRWIRVGTFEEQEQRRARAEYEADPVVKTIKGLLAISPGGIEVTAGEIADFMPQYAGTSMDGQSIGHAINRHKADLYNHDKILHRKKSPTSKKHVFRNNIVNIVNIENIGKAVNIENFSDVQLSVDNIVNPEPVENTS